MPALIQTPLIAPRLDAEVPLVDIEDDNVPLAEDLVDIEDEDVPLADMPDTGDKSTSPIPFAIAMGAAFAGGCMYRYKRRRKG